jgi:hypothetical protein
VSLVTLERRANPHRTLDAGNINLDGMNAWWFCYSYFQTLHMDGEFWNTTSCLQLIVAEASAHRRERRMKKERKKERKKEKGSQSKGRSTTRRAQSSTNYALDCFSWYFSFSQH